jgi:vacuolar fusion protein MON1
MYAYISHLDSQYKSCLILLTGLCDQEQSTELNECRKRIQQKLESQNILQTINMRSRDNSLKLEQIGVAELRNFLFKDNKITQFFLSDFALPYMNNARHQQYVLDMYQSLYHKLHNSTNSLKIIYMQRKYETLLGWMTSDFEIYASFSPLVTKEIMILAVNKVVEFVKRNKIKIFLTATPTLQR